MNKVVTNAEEAIQDVFEGATIMIGGFGLWRDAGESDPGTGAAKGTKNLNTISNNVGVDGPRQWDCFSRMVRFAAISGPTLEEKQAARNRWY